MNWRYDPANDPSFFADPSAQQYAKRRLELAQWKAQQALLQSRIESALSAEGFRVIAYQYRGMKLIALLVEQATGEDRHWQAFTRQDNS